MLLTISTTHSPARDLGYLLHKHPDRLQDIQVGYGRAHIVWPEASDERATCALVLDLDPVQLSRGKGERRDAASLQPYVNDGPYVTSSPFSVALG
jgi:hypothetical protein